MAKDPETMPNIWLDAGFWSGHFDRVFCREITLYVDAVIHRLLPTFDSLGDEAEQVSSDEYDLLGSLTSPDGEPFMDVVEAAERAHEVGIAYYQSLSGVAQAIKSLAAAGLYHLFEQQVMVFHRRQVLGKAEENDVKLINWKVFKARMRNAGVDYCNLPSWQRVHELQLVANTVKHGEGKSAAELSRERPDLFVHPLLRTSGGGETEGALLVEMPLTGEDIYITQEDLEAYRDALLLFWNEFADAIGRVETSRKQRRR